MKNDYNPFYKNMSLTLYSRKGLNLLWCVRDGRTETDGRWETKTDLDRLLY